MKPEEQWTPVDYWNDLQKGDLAPETYIYAGNELAIYAAQLEAENEQFKIKVGHLQALAHDYIQAYEKLAFGDDALGGE